MPNGDDDDIVDDCDDIEIEGNNQSHGESRCCTGDYPMRNNSYKGIPVPESAASIPANFEKSLRVYNVEDIGDRRASNGSALSAINTSQE